MNRTAFHDLYVRYVTDVYRFALWLSGNPAEAEDIASETFVRAWAGRGKIRTETVRAYLLTIARNLYLQQLRRQRRQVALEHAANITAGRGLAPDVYCLRPVGRLFQFNGGPVRRRLTSPAE